ncbi:MAG: MraY family glycosyltransferase [Planctomycetota bacterium]|nr:MraY family glycosyltransferase [Planctomycetota bacterium]
MSTYTATWLAGGASLVLTLALVPIMMLLARRLDMIDRPTHRKIHNEPVPFLGGVAILLGFAGGAGVFLLLSPTLHYVETKKALLVIGAATLAAVLGLADDKFLLRPRYKLAGQFLIAVAFVAFGYRFQALRLPGIQTVDLLLLGPPLTVLWILMIVNAVNFIDGVDGLAASVVLVICVIAGLLANCFNDTVVVAVVLAAGGALAAYLWFNWHPARIYMGDAGSLALGMLVATSLVSLGQDCSFGLGRRSSEPFYYQMALVTLVAAYPVLEILLTVARRLLRGKPIGSADRGHIHHRLIDQGWTPPYICFAAVFVSLLAGGAVIYYLVQSRGAAVWFLVASALTVGVGLHFCGVLDDFRSSVIKTTRPHFLLVNHFIAMQRIKLDMAESVADLHALLAQTCSELGVQCMSLTVATTDGQAGKHEFSWRREPQTGDSEQLAESGTAGSAGFSDRTELCPGTSAEWTFEPTAREEDIDVEYRVLMSEFMHRALGRAEQLYPKAGRSQLSAPVEAGPVSRPALLLWRSDDKGPRTSR